MTLGWMACWRCMGPLEHRRHGDHVYCGNGPLERSLSWLHQFRRLRVRWERRADIHQAFLSVACVLICCDFAVRLL